jgi:hypothetical protein
MDRFFEILKRHPLWILGAVVALVLIFWFAGRGGSSSQPVIVSTGPSDMTVAQNAETERARIAAQQQGAAGVVATELAKIQADAYTQFLSTSRDVADIQSDRDVQIAGIAGNTQTSLASIITGAQTTQTQIAANTATDLANIDKAKSESLANINASLEKEKIAGQLASAQTAAAASASAVQAQEATKQLELNIKQNLSGYAGVMFNPSNWAALWSEAPNSVTNVNANVTQQPYSYFLSGN